MTGAKISQTSGEGIQFGEKCGGEAAAIHIIGAGLAVQSNHEIGKRTARPGQRSKTGLKCGHEHGRRDALAGNVRDGEQQGAVNRAAKGIVIVARDGLGRPCCEGHIHSGNVRRDAGNQPALDFAGDFNVSLHGDVIAEDHHQQ